jgi:hypothetical protein
MRKILSKILIYIKNTKKRMQLHYEYWGLCIFRYKTLLLYTVYLDT